MALPERSAIRAALFLSYPGRKAGKDSCRSTVTFPDPASPQFLRTKERYPSGIGWGEIWRHHLYRL